MIMKAVNFSPVILHIMKKVEEDRKALSAITIAPKFNDITRDFAEQDRLLSEIQAGLRAIDVLTGITDLYGDYIHQQQEPQRQENFRSVEEEVARIVADAR